MVTLDKLKDLISGAVRIWEEDGWFFFSRFTMGQEENLRRRGYAPKERASASMRLEFLSHGGELSFGYGVSPGSSRDYYGIEIAVDGLGMQHICHERMPHTGSVHYSIPHSRKAVRITVYFPNLAELRIRKLCLPEDAVPCIRRWNYLALGDSITQGYDAVHPNQTYVNLLADAWDARVLNQAIGGDVFCPESLDPELPFNPDLITVAYGTNDWKKEELSKNAGKLYLDKLTRLYPQAMVYVLLPIWREAENDVLGGITLQQGRERIAGWAQGRANVQVVDCHRFVPYLKEYFYDGVLHPNDMGFLCYANALKNAIAGVK